MAKKKEGIIDAKGEIKEKAIKDKVSLEEKAAIKEKPKTIRIDN
jgi:hypothetical protein